MLKANQTSFSGSDSTSICVTKYCSPTIRCLLLPFLLISILIAGQAQSNAGFILQGQVVDQTGSSVRDASVLLRDDKQNDVGVENTDQEGRFVFNDVSAGNYSIAVKAEGFTRYMGE